VEVLMVGDGELWWRWLLWWQVVMGCGGVLVPEGFGGGSVGGSGVVVAATSATWWRRR
jgi:hypothetical protein